MDKKVELIIDPIALQERVGEINQKIKDPSIFFFESMNWLHPININIALYNRLAAINPKKSGVETPVTASQPSIANKIKFKFSQFINKAKSVFYEYKTVKIIKHYKEKVQGNPLNFLLDNYNAYYNGKYFNTFGDNVNCIEKGLTNIFLSNSSNRDRWQQAHFKPLQINEWIKHYPHPHKKKEDFPIAFTHFLETHLETAEFIFVKDTLQRTYHYYCFFLWLLNEWKPSKIYLYDSYNEFSLGLIGAAKKLKIKVIEQQHGIIYPTHYGYQYQYENIGDRFICDELHYYTAPLFKGLPAFWKFSPQLKRINHSPNYEIWKKFGKDQNIDAINSLKQKAGDKTIISFGLTIYPLPGWLVDALVGLDKTGEYFFCFRSHPHHREKLMDHLCQLEKSLINMDHEICSSLPLFTFMNISGYFLSDGSSTLLDALEFHLPVACFNQLSAVAVFQPYIQLGEITLLNDREQFIEFLASGKNKRVEI